MPPVAPSVMPVASRPAVHAPARWGVALIVFFVLAFGSWGCLVPLDGGAVAPGVVNPDSGKKTIQHLEGGIIAELPVREGERVKAGQPLVVLESTQARAAHETLVQQQLSLLARKARLEAERAGLCRIDLPAELRAATRTSSASLMPSRKCSTRAARPMPRGARSWPSASSSCCTRSRATRRRC